MGFLHLKGGEFHDAEQGVRVCPIGWTSHKTNIQAGPVFKEQTEPTAGGRQQTAGASAIPGAYLIVALAPLGIVRIECYTYGTRLWPIGAGRAHEDGERLALPSYGAP